MKTLLFTLSMPNCGSWNGRWSGEKNIYAKTRRIMKEQEKNLKFDLSQDNYFRYDFGDGWAAGISVDVVDAKEANKMLKKSRGFCGYDWMIDSILKNGEIIYEK